MKNHLNLIFKKSEDKTIVWSQSANEYLVLENTTAAILNKIHLGIDIQKIALELAEELSIPIAETIKFVSDLKKKTQALLQPQELEVAEIRNELKKPKQFEFIKYYWINSLIFKIEFHTEYELYLVHPKFAHLEIKARDVPTYTFSVFSRDTSIYFYVDELFIDVWDQKEVHFFQGKFSMEFIQKIHQKKESEWLGVFHASAVSNGEKAILFLGDSGNGKSTSLALLQASGFTCLADDFVPIASESKEVYSFPEAISIKKNSLEALLPIYPELANSAEYHFKRLQKIVRYLKPNNTNFLNHLSCKDLVFIKYEKDSTLKFTKISKIEAFQQLVPDSWLSPIRENAQSFLDWFESLNCYQITYSENDKMISAVTKIFNNEL
jgi:hypothetical protein